jgi:hypothetical protein
MKKKNSKTSKIFASYEADLSLIINWLRLNKVLSSVGKISKSDNGIYSVIVKAKVSKKEISSLVKDRFGVFAKVK